MKKTVIKCGILFGIFLVALVVFSILTNQTNEDLTTTMKEASLPVVSFQYNGVDLDELHGYTQEMDPTMVRGAILPVGEERKLHLCIDTYEQEIDQVAYELRSLDGTQLLADGTIEDFTETDGLQKANVVVENIIEENQECLYILTLTMGEKQVYYYTRLVQTTDCHVDESLAFAMEFHDYTFREDGDEFIPTYMDAATGDATTLQYVDLTCTLKQIMWADFDGEVLGTPMAYFQEITPSYNALTLDYVLVRKNEDGEKEYYNVEEYYRLRDASSRMYVLNFERTMNEIFVGENHFASGSNAILLGIRAGDVDYVTNEGGDLVAFVQEGDLWCYNSTNDEMNRVFSFRNNEGIDTRENWDQHQIKVVRIDEAGSVDFIVYGYMNRGQHEGQVGIGVYHFDGISHTVEEEAFLPVNQSYQVLDAELGQLMYENDNGQLFFVMQGTVYCLNLSTREVTTQLTGLTEDCYAVSESNRYFAYVTAEDYDSASSIQILDLKNGKKSTIEAEKDTYIRPLDFIGENFIYGQADSSLLSSDMAGNVIFPMSKLCIMSFADGEQTLLKDYQPAAGYVSQISVSDYTIYVDLIKRQSGGYIDGGEDEIMDREAGTDQVSSVSALVTADKETQLQLNLTGKVDDEKSKYIVSKELLTEEDRTIELPEQKEQEQYYVYAKGKAYLATDNLSKAILKANEVLGVVVDSSQNYVWQRARNTSVDAKENVGPSESDVSGNDLAKCLSAMLYAEGKTVNATSLLGSQDRADQVLAQQLAEASVYEMSGLSLDEMLYYISKGSTVLAITSDNRMLVLIGYTSTNVIYYDPQTGMQSSQSMETLQEEFGFEGGTCLTYLKNSL